MMKLIRRISIITIVVVVIVTLTQDASIVRNATSKFLPLQQMEEVQDVINATTSFNNVLRPFLTRLVTNNHHNYNKNDTSLEKDLEYDNNGEINETGIEKLDGSRKNKDNATIVDNHDVDGVQKSIDNATIISNQDNHDSLPSTNETISQQSHNYSRPTTIVVKLSGEMGNSLSKFATARGLQLWAKESYGMETEFVVRHQNSTKWISARNNVQRCFPNLRGYDFAQGNTPAYDKVKVQQRQWLGNQSSLLLMETAQDEFDVEETLTYLQTVLSWTNSSTMNGDKSNDHNSTTNNNITLPYVKADYLAMIDFWIDKYYDEYRKYFKFDRRKCCNLKPDPDESVFHFRNFLKEMPRKGKRLGFEELTPNQTAYELFRNLRAGDKVAITSRFSSDPSMQPYVNAFVERGIQVRVIENQSPVEDFCFLMHAKKELVGTAESSFVIWAGYLGNPDKVRLYSINSAARRKSMFSDRVFKYYNWTNPALQAKVFFELYDANEDDQSTKL